MPGCCNPRRIIWRIVGRLWMVLTEKLGRTMANRLTKEAGQLALCRQRLSTAENAVLAGERKRLETSAARLDAMSPLKVLSRGYSITENNRALPLYRQVLYTPATISLSASIGAAQTPGWSR